MKSILITGCNRGLGLGLVNCILREHNPKHIFATCRTMDKAGELKEIANKHQNVHIVELGIAQRSTRISFADADQMMDTFFVNTVAPVMLTKAFLPLLKKASKVNKNLPMGISKAAVINMSSSLGSISQNSEGGQYPYRCSKAALNAATKSMCIDLKSDDILVVSMHPGWVRTDMGGSKAPLGIEESVHGIVKTIFNINKENNGGFIQYDGKTVPW